VHFKAFSDDIERGLSLVSSLDQLKSRVGTIHSDRLCELLCVVSSAGGAGLIETLRNQVQLVRKELAFSGEISSKVGWITGTAKIAVGAPWLIVAMLSSRPENASAYASTEGSLLLLIGLLVSIFAYRLVQMLGTLPPSPRVFA
jgi:tight adherence protein B